MTTLDKIKAEIQKVLNKERDFTSENAKAQALALVWVLELFDKYAEQEPTYNKLSFPNTFDEFVEQYGITDTDEVYTNGSKLIPAFRVKQWLMEANINGYTQGLKDASKAEQEPCENCDYSEITDWEQDAKTGKAKPIYWCERHKEPCDDAVNRQAVLDVIYGQHIGGKEAVEHGLRNTYAGDLREIADEIIALPPVRPQEPKTGRWINKEFRKEEYVLIGKCSVCGRGRVIDGFCLYCGCRMVEPQESEVDE